MAQGDRRTGNIGHAPERRGGRPRISQEPNASISTWMPASAHDRLIRIARTREMSVSELVRTILIFQLDR